MTDRVRSLLRCLLLPLFLVFSTPGAHASVEPCAHRHEMAAMPHMAAQGHAATHCSHSCLCCVGCVANWLQPPNPTLSVPQRLVPVRFTAAPRAWSGGLTAAPALPPPRTTI